MRKTGEPTNTTEPQGDEGFLGRWSRRKRATQSAAQGTQAAPIDNQEDECPPRAPVDAAGTDSDGESTATDTAADAEHAAVLTDADMPALDSLGDDDDYSGFMSSGVSEGLRNKALRRLFSSAQFNVLDGLNDYDDDFTNFEPLGDIITSDMRHRMEEEAKRVAQQLCDEGLSDEPGLTDASRLEAGTSTKDASAPTLEAQSGQQRVDAAVAHDDATTPPHAEQRSAADAHEDPCAPDESDIIADELQRGGESPATAGTQRSDAKDG